MRGEFVLHYCKLHPKFKNINLSSIEHHCKYDNPELHKSEILRLLNDKQQSKEEEEENKKEKNKTTEHNSTTITEGGEARS
jgi:hypothetical protein